MSEPGVVVIVCFEDERRARFLMVRHRTRGWELPGGRIEDGESPRDAARRELAEETGRDLLDARVVECVEKEDGGYWVVTGRVGDVVASGAVHEPVVATRLVERLSDVAPLAFPDDPYERIGEALGRPLR